MAHGIVFDGGAERVAMQLGQGGAIDRIAEHDAQAVGVAEPERVAAHECGVGEGEAVVVIVALASDTQVGEHIHLFNAKAEQLVRQQVERQTGCGCHQQDQHQLSGAVVILLSHSSLKKRRQR